MAESEPCDGEERQGLGFIGSPENRLSLKPINIPMGGGDEGHDGKSSGVIVEARVESKISSKGLGCSKDFKGRMRARLDDQGKKGSDSSKNKTWNLTNGSEEAKCPVCSKSFHSKKAMHGHMRCHPEREWRGINPPPPAKTASSSSVSQEIDGLSHASMTSTVVSSDISPPSEPPLPWTKTGRRGQNRIINSYSSRGSSCNISLSLKKGIEEKHQASECVGLQKMQKRQQIKMLQVGNLRDYPSKKLKIHERGALGFRGQEDAGNKSGASWKDFLKTGFNLGPKEVDTDKKTSDDRIIPDGQPDDQIANNTKNMTQKFVSYFHVSDNKRFLKTVLPRKYKCSTSNKAFPAYQAFSGSGSSHSYKKSLAVENQYASSSHAAAYEEEGQALGTSKHAKQEVQKSHKCRICNKSFPTGQALGGHQTTHRQKAAQLAGPKQEALILSAEAARQSAGPRVLDFDLNELPPMEKE